MKRTTLTYISVVSILSMVGLFVVHDRANATVSNLIDIPPGESTYTPISLEVTDTPTVEPPSSYERPVIVVDSYSLSQDTISPGDSFTLYVTLYNAGQKYATNIVAVFTPGELMPRNTGGVVAVSEIAPGNHSQFGQPLVLSSTVWGADTSIDMQISYTDEAGASYSASFVITLPIFYSYSYAATATSTPTQSPTPSTKPQLVITSYSTDIIPLQPGTQFKLSLNIQNVGNSTAKRVTMVVGGGSSSSTGDGGTPQPGGISGTSGDFTNFAPIGASNVQSLGDFASGYGLPAYQPLIVNVSTSPGAYPLKISFVYIDEQNHVLVDDQVITLLVYRLPIVEISFYQEVPTLLAGQPNTLPLQVVNLGRSSVLLGNMRVTAPSGQFSNNSILIGNLDSGGYFTLDASFIPDTSGPVDLLVSVDYTNDFNQPQVITKTISVDVQEQPIIEPPVDGGQNNGGTPVVETPETFLQKVWRFLLGLIGLDSGRSTNQPIQNQPVATQPSQKPIIVPAQPIKGP